MVRQNVALALEDLGYKVLLVANGDIALAKLADASSADVIISVELKGGNAAEEAPHMHPTLRALLTLGDPEIAANLGTYASRRCTFCLSRPAKKVLRLRSGPS
jgi:hypothetical protein